MVFNIDNKPNMGFVNEAETGKEVHETMAQTLRDELVIISKLVNDLVEVAEVKTAWSTQNRAELERLRRLSRQQLIDTSAEARKFRTQLEALLTEKSDQN